MITGQISIISGTPLNFIGVGVVNGGFIIKAPVSNTGVVVIGSPPPNGTLSSLANGNGNGFMLTPGESVQIGRENGGTYQATGTVTGDIVTWIAY